MVIEHRDVIVSILVYTINGPVKVLFINSNLLPAGGSSSANGPQHLSSDFSRSSGQKKIFEAENELILIAGRPSVTVG